MKAPGKRVMRLLSILLAITTFTLTGCGSSSESSAPSAITQPLNLSNNQAASAVIGQADFTHGSPNQGGATPSANSLNSPYGNPLVANGVLYIPDLGNSRVLGFNQVPTLTQNASADFVLGQPLFTSLVVAPTASGMAWPQTVVAENNQLFLVDMGFLRVTIYDGLPTSGPGTASLVLGQPEFTTIDPIGPPPTAASMTLPESVAVVGGKLIVTDSSNNRVLIWDTIPTVSNTAADHVLGQADFVHYTKNDENQDGVPDTAPSAKTLFNPTGVWSDGTHLLVADSGNNRVLVWNTFPTANQVAADAVLGQKDFLGSAANDFAGSGVAGVTPTADSLSYPYAIFSKEGQLFIADRDNNRVLVWNRYFANPHQAADIVLGQSNFTTNYANSTGSAASATPSATSLWRPSGLFIDGDKLMVSDSLNNRLLIFTSN